MRTLWQDRTLQEVFRLSRCISGSGDVGGSGDRLRRRCEVARIAGVKSRSVEGLVPQIEAGAELVGIDVLPHLVKTQTEVQGQLVGDPPLVLEVDSGDPTELRIIVGDRKRCVDGIPL